jgi:hypothetical protein
VTQPNKQQTIKEHNRFSSIISRRDIPAWLLGNNKSSVASEDAETTTQWNKNLHKN